MSGCRVPSVYTCHSIRWCLLFVVGVAGNGCENERSKDIVFMVGENKMKRV